jgi:hypothetical protein
MAMFCRRAVAAASGADGQGTRGARADGRGRRPSDHFTGAPWRCWLPQLERLTGLAHDRCLRQPAIARSSLIAGMQREGIDSLEDFLVHDERESEYEEHRKRHDGQVDQPVPVILLLLGDPPLYRR